MLQFEISKSFSESFSITNRNEESCAKLENAMLKGASLVIKAFTSKDGYPIFKMDAVYPLRTDNFYIPAYTEIAQAVINYLLQGKASEIKFDEERFEASKTEQDLSLELFKLMVEKRVRVNTLSVFKGAKYFNAFIQFRKGRIVFNFLINEELEKYLMENNLI
ncbi:MAG: hypothetical protein E6772_10285 [Dysgonomonas sp.]|nr:hypothetical protein [Dysgonomonas sp.]